MRIQRPLLVVILVGGALTAVSLFSSSSEAARPQKNSGTIYTMSAKKARWNHRLMGPPTAFVDGVPAQPVDSFCWNGVGSRPIVDASVTVQVDPIYNRGRIRARWTDSYGTWTYDQTNFDHPHHPSGVQVGPSMEDTVEIINDPIVTNVYLHGDTTAGAPVLPTVFAFQASWGFAEVTLNGKPFLNPFDPPAHGLWPSHIMTTAGVREPDGTVLNTSGEIYSMSQASDGYSDPQDIELHLVFHDEMQPNTANIPPLFEFFYHLVFEDVEINISHVD